MNLPAPDQHHIVFLYSDTGGGHRSAAHAIIEAMELEFPQQVKCEMVDILRDYTPPPFNRGAEIYPVLSHVPDLWGFSYRITDGPKRVRLLNEALWPYVRPRMEALVKDHPCDLVVSLHQWVNIPVQRVLHRHNIPFATVVIDMVSTHAIWYDRDADLVIVPTEAARQRGLKSGVQPEKIHLVGMPIAERFNLPSADKAVLRHKLGWPQNLPVVLLIGGGDGIGPIETVARAIDKARLPLMLAVICGRNHHLETHLQNLSFQIPCRIFGFVNDMHDFMRAADILVTKAGPGTISEGFCTGLPIILYSKMPGQEDGNVTYVEQEGAGVWAPTPEKVVETLGDWLDHPQHRKKMAQNSHALARPQASRQIARLLVKLTQKKPDLLP
jgi:1,2-diacylglycerol 3-beta-galactosyltransferase